VTFEIEIGGRSRAVSVERVSGGHFRVTVDGATHEVDAARSDEFGLSLLVDGGSSREIAVSRGAAPGELLVGIEGRTVGVTVNGRRTRRSGGDLGGHGHGEAVIVAPMPGRVVRVLVAAGDAVEAKQGVVVVEAMKMENELRSPKAGRVKEVAVSVGASVEAGRVLVVVE
jgi:biotin carboxyl carrier protein